ncbi:DUF4169 family protein [Pseudooceanicola algae]
MAKIVNLNQVRKDKARAGKRAKGDENALRFGLGKAQKRLDQAHADKHEGALDGHRLERPENVAPEAGDDDGSDPQV